MIIGGFKNMNADKIIQCILAAMLKLEKTVDSDLNDKLNHGGYQGNAQDLSDSIESIYQPDTVIRYTAPTRVGNTFTFPSAGYDVLLSKQFHTNVSELETTIAAATDGFKRIDLIYYKADDTIAKIQGTESTTVAVRPEVPAGCIELCLINVFGATIEVPEVNGAYVQKSERANVVLTGSGVINQLNLVDEKATIVFKGSITQLNTISYASVPYNGKRITLFNAQATPVTIGHSVSGYGVDFVFPDGQDYVLKPNETIEFSFDITYAPYAHHRLIGAILDISGKEDESNKGAPNGYAPLDEFTKLSAQYLNIVNDLATGGATALLSAEQGKVLQTQISAINTLLTSDNVNLDNVQEIVDAIETVQMSLSTILVNDLTTGGTAKALTAEMGKTLKELISAIETFTEQKVRDTVLTGLSVPTATASWTILASDKIITALGRLQFYINTLFTEVNLRVRKVEVKWEVFNGSGGITVLPNNSDINSFDIRSGVTEISGYSSSSSYSGLIYSIKNTQNTPITLRHMTSNSVQLRLVFQNGLDYILNPGCIARFSYVGTGPIGENSGALWFLGELGKQDIANQVEVSASQNAQASWHGKTVIFTANCTITIPEALIHSYIFSGITLPGVTVNWAITSPKTWLLGTPTPTAEKQIFTMMQRGDTNSILLLGV